MTPLAIEVALTVQQELAIRHEEADRLRRQRMERARYEADLAQRRFLKVAPDNRLVADTLEADWDEKLRAIYHLTDRPTRLLAQGLLVRRTGDRFRGEYANQRRMPDGNS